MKLLAYDTSSETLSAALFDGPKKIAELESPAFTRHSSVLVPTLEKLLKVHGMPLNRIDVLAVGLGPGSFTGLRVGITAAKIFSYASPMKVIGVSSLEAMALGAGDFDGEIAVILYARKEKLYAAIFRVQNKELKVVRSPRLVKIDALLKGIKRPRLFLGDGVKIYRDQILKTDRCRIAESAESARPKASHIAERAIVLAKRKKWSNPFSLEPSYLHPRDCNVTVRRTYGARRHQVSRAQSSREGAAQHRRGIYESAGRVAR